MASDAVIKSADTDIGTRHLICLVRVAGLKLSGKSWTSTASLIAIYHRSLESPLSSVCSNAATTLAHSYTDQCCRLSDVGRD